MKSGLIALLTTLPVLYAGVAWGATNQQRTEGVSGTARSIAQQNAAECLVTAFPPKRRFERIRGSGKIECTGEVLWHSLRVCLQRYAGFGNQWNTIKCAHRQWAGAGTNRLRSEERRVGKGVDLGGRRI